MSVPVAMTVATYVLLGMAICAAWCAPIRIGTRLLHPWLILLLAATLAGLFAHVLAWPALASLLILVALAQQAASPGTPDGRRKAALASLLAWSLALALHALPGFHNVLL